MSTPIVTTTKKGTVASVSNYMNYWSVSVQPDDGSASEVFQFTSRPDFSAGNKVTYTVTTGPSGPLPGDLRRSS